MPDALLTILKFCLVALLYLFFFRVLRAVWVEIHQPAPSPARPQPAGPTRPARSAPPNAPPAPAAGGRAGARAAPGTLKILEPPEQKGTVFPLTEEATIGRAAGCHVRLDDTFASQLHARVFQRDGQYFVEDLGSTNGTTLNGNKVGGPAPLRRGDRLKIGGTVLEVSR